jgi:tellurite resistance protein
VLKTAMEAVRLNLDRFSNRGFLDATMAASALVATADGQVKFAELYALDSVIQNVRELSIFNAHKAVDTYRRYADSIVKDPDRGVGQAMATIAKLAGKPHASRVLVRACIVIGKSDGDFCQTEVEMIDSICSVLGIDPNDPAIPGAASNPL